jgi:hypothetical protein
MQLKNLLMLNAIVSCASGICAVLIPGPVLSLYGVASGPAVILMAQYAGLGSIVIGMIAWLARVFKDSDAQRAIILALFIANIIGAIISVLGTTSGIMKVGWPVVGLYLLFALGYAYFLFIKQNTL